MVPAASLDSELLKITSALAELVLLDSEILRLWPGLSVMRPRLVCVRPGLSASLDSEPSRFTKASRLAAVAALDTFFVAFCFLFSGWCKFVCSCALLADADRVVVVWEVVTRPPDTIGRL